MEIEIDLLIEKFLKKQLSKEETILFNKNLESDTSFKEKYVAEKQLFQTLNEKSWSFEEDRNTKEIKEYLSVINSSEITSLKKQLKSENAIYQKSILKKSKSFSLYIAAAVIIIFFSVINFIDFNKSTQDLYASNISETELTSIITRGSSDELSKAQTFFENKKYERALAIFNRAIKDKKNQVGSMYIYTGIAQMELNQLDAAEKTWNDLIQSDLLDAEKGYWFKALLFLKKDKPNKSKTILEKIVKDKLYNFNKAKILLEEIS